MDFFASQEAAHKSSRYLLLLFIVAIASVVALANLTVYVVLKFQTLGASQFDLTFACQITGAVLFLILAGSLYRIHSLKRGGEAIAAALGGHLVVDSGRDEYEQRLINVVEEMAIASGLPVPPVYLIDEEGINAFAAGYNTNDAVIGITRGALKSLNREQLQGVVAHEFSHIMHGDMSLNLRLVGLLHGILMLSHAGKLMLEARPGVARRSTGAAPVLFLGMSLFLIGYLGKFFGDLIKAGVSRQREFLADAAAVQYTRNNLGIAGALKVIGGHVAGSNVHRAGAQEFSHLYFSPSSRQSLMSMLATHPPLDERIQRLEPSWSGEYLFGQMRTQTDTVADPINAQTVGAQGFAASNTQASVQSVVSDTNTVVGQIGRLDVAAKLLGGIAPSLRSAVRETYSVRAAVYGLFLHGDASRRAAQDAVLKSGADVFVRARMRELSDDIDQLSDDQKLPLLELALPALKQLSANEYGRLETNVKAIVRAAAPISLSVWALSYYLQHHMGEGLRYSGRSYRIENLKPDIEYLLSVLAHSDSTSSEHAFSIGVSFLGVKLSLQSKSEISVARLERSLERLNRLKPLQKPKVLKAFVAVIGADRVMNPVEVELVRCFADAIDCPLPPLALD